VEGRAAACGGVGSRGECGGVECLSTEGHAVDAGRGLGADGGRPCSLRATRGAAARRGRGSQGDVPEQLGFSTFPC
jgi:hypothetical protein